MIWLAAMLLLQRQMLELPTASNNPHATAADLALGKKLYGGRCAGCHGPAGDGGKGANLAASLPRAQDDRALYRIIRYGIPETEMPGFNMAPREIWQVAAFVRGLGRVPRETISGDTARGRQLVRGKGGCLQCHAVGTEGGHLGPPLAGIGTRRSATHIRNKLLTAESDIPDNFRLVDLTTKTGRKVSGMRLNEDTWSIQVRDLAGSLHSFWKADLANLTTSRRTPMPSYGQRLSANEIDDIVAYLAAPGSGQ